MISLAASCQAKSKRTKRSSAARPAICTSQQTCNAGSLEPARKDKTAVMGIVGARRQGSHNSCAESEKRSPAS